VVTIVFEASPEATVSLGGCMQGTDPAFNATHAGAVSEDDRAQALVTVMPQGRPAFALVVERQPPGRVDDAVTVTLIDATGFPFRRAENLPRCALTCADLGIAQTFVPGGAP
jgi:hypothetical protein